MRRFVVGLVALAGCAGSDGLLLPGQAPPPYPLHVRVSPLTPGSAYTVTVEDAPAGASVVVGTGAALGAGPCPPTLGGLCLGLVGPQVAATVTANPQGRAVAQLTLPPGFAAPGLGFQAAVIRGRNSRLSDAVWVEVSPSAPGAACHAFETAGVARHRAFVPVDGHDPAVDWAAARLRTRPVTLTGTGDVTVDGVGATLWDANGAPLPLPLTVAAGDLPLTVLLHGDAEGVGALTATSADPACAPEKLTVDVGRVELAGHSLPGAPWFEHARGVWWDEAVEVAVDGVRHADKAGQAYTAWVVPHRSDAEWAADATLSSVSPPQAGAVVAGRTQDNIGVLLAGPLSFTGLTRDLDVVLDFDGDGLLGPGDLLQGGDAGPAFVAMNNPTTAGPYGSRQIDWTAPVSGGLTGERIYAPQVLPAAPMPVVIISHGNGHDYRWYDYLGTHLASWGYVVMSHASNTGPGPQAASVTLLDHIDAFLANMPSHFGGALVGRVAPEMSWIGHSRGGEAVAIAFDDLVEGRRTSPFYGPDNIVSVHSIAPTVFLGAARADPHEAVFHLIAGGADGDVTGGVDCPVCEYPRIAGYADGRTLVTYVHGAAHNDFHGGNGWNDGTGPALIGKARTQAIAKATFLGALEWHHRGVTVFEELFTRGQQGWPLSAMNPSDVVARSLVPGPTDGAVFVDDFQRNLQLDVSSSGGQVTVTAIEVGEALMDDRNTAFSHDAGDPMNGMTEVEGDGDQRGLAFSWDGHAYVEWALPANGADLRGFDLLTLRAAQGTRHSRTIYLGDAAAFGLTLRDGSGRSVTVRPGWSYRATEPYPRTGLGAGAGWANEFSTVAVRLTDFLRDGTDLDLSDVVAVRLDLGPFYGSPSGRLIVDDVALVVEGVQ